MILRQGDSGEAVAEIRSRLEYLGLITPSWQGSSIEQGVDVLFDETIDLAIRTFQQERGLTVDGIVGPQTLRRLDEARWQLGDRVLHYKPGSLISGDDVAELQRRLNELGFDSGRADGFFGHQTDSAMREFQRGVGLEGDGTCGPDTFKAFDRLVRTISGGNAHILRDNLALLQLQTGISDKVVVLDSGSSHGKDICHSIAMRVEGRLAALGTQVLLTHYPHAEPAPAETERADFANRNGADLVISLHLDDVISAKPNGVVTYYYGHPGGGMHSSTGQALAEVIQRHVCQRTGALDCQILPRTWDLLRLTRMPAVRIDIGYLSNPQDRMRLEDPVGQDACAEAIAQAIRVFCSPVPGTHSN